MLVLVSAVMPVALTTTTATAQVNLSAVNHGRFISAVKGQVLPTRNATTSSLNWSGYATAPGSGITGVNSTFKVPAVSAVPPGFAANWTGIGVNEATPSALAPNGQSFNVCAYKQSCATPAS